MTRSVEGTSIRPIRRAPSSGARATEAESFAGRLSCGSEAATPGVVATTRVAVRALWKPSSDDEWLVARRYLSEESLALVLQDQGEEGREEVPALQAA